MYKAVLSVSSLETYAVFPYILKTGSDTLESLCDAQDGLLRTRASLTTQEQNAIRIWWRVEWHTLQIAFKMTERWSHSISSSIMTNFVRDTMDFADAMFNNYSVFASALESSTAGSSDKLRKDLLNPPRKSMSEIAKWLRLRDPYLVGTSVNLVGKLLRRLGEFDMEIEDEANTFIENTLQHSVKTVLTGQQKAELRRALNEHFGVEEIETPILARPKLKDGTINFQSWTKDQQTSIRSANEERSLTRNLDQNRHILDQMRSKKLPLPLKANNALKGESIKESREREKKARQARDAARIADAKRLRGESAMVAGEGSALTGLGNTGKEHEPQRGGEIMVSSDSESDSDTEEGASSIIRRRMGVKKGLLDPRIPLQEGPVKKTRIARSAKDMRARLTPPMEPLHQIILNWEFFHEGIDPPSETYCKKVDDRFRTPRDYSDTFFPLLVNEAWLALRTAEERSNLQKYEMKVASRMSVDNFFEVSTSTMSLNGKDKNVSEGDIVLLSKSDDPLGDRSAPHCLARVSRKAKKGQVTEVTYRIGGNSSSQTGLFTALAPNLLVWGVKITSLTTVEREYAALHSLQYYDLCEEVLSAKPSPLLRYSDQDIARMQQRYELNSGQAKAILSARDNDGFTLIQG